jgi:hypothetical protein
MSDVQKTGQVKQLPFGLSLLQGLLVLAVLGAVVAVAASYFGS